MHEIDADPYYKPILKDTMLSYISAFHNHIYIFQ